MTDGVSNRTSTGIPGLDDILGGGLTPQRGYLVEGSPGAGKTTLGLQFLLDGVARGESGMYITLSETTDELLAVGRSHGWDLGALSIVELAGDDDLEQHELKFRFLLALIHRCGAWRRFQPRRFRCIGRRAGASHSGS